MKAMRNAILSLLVLAMVSTGYAQEKTGKTNEKNKQEIPVKPKAPKMSKKEMQKNIAENAQKDFAIKENENTTQAIKILGETQEVINFIAKNKDKKAKEKLAKLIGELEIMMTKDPNLALVPVDVSYEVNDAVVDIPAAKAITKAAKEEMDKGYYQTAKELMNSLSSELKIKTAYLPFATYPDAMRLAAALLDKGKKQEATDILVKALNTLVIQEVKLPLPILRAEEYIKAAAKTMLNEKKDKKEVAVLYLDNAEYQLDLAEAMGYGKKDKEFKELHTVIKALKEDIKSDKETKAKFDSLKEKIKKFKERLFFKKK